MTPVNWDRFYESAVTVGHTAVAEDFQAAIVHDVQQGAAAKLRGVDPKDLIRLVYDPYSEGMTGTYTITTLAGKFEATLEDVEKVLQDLGFGSKDRETQIQRLQGFRALYVHKITKESWTR